MTERRMRLLRRLSAASIGGLLVLALATLGVLPLIESWAATSDSIDRSSRLLAGYQRVVNQRQEVDQRFEALRQQDAALTGLIGGATSALALASLQTDVKQIVEAHGGKVQSMQPGQVTQSHSFERVEVKVDLSVSGEMFADLLAALDSHRPYLSIDPLELHAADGAQRTANLVIRMTVGAYRRSAAS